MINFDFIIIGGGASGSALASVLASKGPTLLIERGGNYSSYPQTYFRTGWPQISNLATKSQRFEDSGHWIGNPNILGGESSVNEGACWRADKSTFLSLGLDIDQVDNAYEFLEDRLCKPALETEYSEIFGDAWSSLGMNHDNSTSGQIHTSGWGDENGNKKNMKVGHEDSGIIQRARTIMSVQNQQMEDAKDFSTRRPSSHLFEEHYLNEGGNLTVYLLTTAKRIIFDHKKSAKGVDIESPSGNATIYVRNGGKIFLNTGAIESPKLLMLSGIGPRDVLSKFGIPVIHENDFVGKNLIDRKQISLMIPSFRNIGGDDGTMFDIAAFTKSVWTSISNKYSQSWGNAQHGCLFCDPADRTLQCKEMLELGFILGMNKQINVPLATQVVFQRRPTARGNITLVSANVYDDVKAYDGWGKDYESLSVEARNDLATITSGVQDLVLKAMRETALMRNLGYSRDVSQEITFAPELVQYLSAFRTELMSASSSDLVDCNLNPSLLTTSVCSSWDDCYPTLPQLPNDVQKLPEEVLKLLSSAHHISGSCSVDDVVQKGSLEVKGVDSLYITDLSVMKESIDTHPLITAMGIGLVAGHSTQAVPTGQYETFPIVLSIFCMTIILLVLILFLIFLFWNEIKQKRMQNIEEHYSLPEMDESNDNVRISAARLEETVNVSNKKTLMMWRGVSCSYPIKNTFFSKMPKGSSITTLSNCFGMLKEGEITAVMGPSGAAKSTLVDILAGRKSLGNITGMCSTLGTDYDFSTNDFRNLNKAIMNISAYVPQREFFYPTQTLEEAIHFIVNMKFGKGNPRNRRALVHRYLDMAGLPSIAYATRKIGGDIGSGFVIRGLSGGERKRLALACMLALKPKIMFIDELTSGLDSENALMIMRLLKDLSIKQQVSSMVIIHQPDPEVFALFDRLILLSKGHTIFSGELSGLSDFYNINFNESLPSDIHLAKDLITKASTCDTRSISFRGDIREQEENIVANNSDEEIIDLGTLDLSKHIGFDLSPTKFWKLLIVFQRNLRNQYIRNVTNVAARIASYTMISFINGAIFWKVGEAETMMGLNFEESMLLIRGSGALVLTPYLLPVCSIPTFIIDKQFFASESALGLYSSWMYGICELFLEFMFVAFASIIQAVIFTSMCAMYNPIVHIWAALLTVLAGVIMTSLIGSTLVFCCTMLLPTQDMAFLLCATLIALSLVLSGAFRPPSDMPEIVHAIHWISPIKYGYQSFLISFFTGTSSERMLDMQGTDTPPTVTDNLLVSIGFFLFLCLVSFIAMTRIKEIR